ncbi:MAG: DNA polymerase II large subunit [Candidatus Bathyarchaeota archaeon]|nr:MAG: DNA polymerase II large subunit [Candidatus Bathyarchaeota archaeon]
MNRLQMSEEYREYFGSLEEGLNELYEVAKRARSKGLDPTLEPEPQITRDIAERIEKLIGPPGIGERMRELSGIDRRELAFRLAEEIVEGRFGEMDREAAADQAIRTALAIMTEGVTIAPIQGIPDIKIKQNLDKSPYLAVYFAGPIRPAGGTAQALTLVVADFVRRRLGLDRYRPTDEAVGRFIEEVRLYEREVRRFQYHVTDEDLEIALKNITVEATGVSTDPFEVSNFRDVPGVETNRLRGGGLIVVVDGIVGRAQKLLGICENLDLDGWDWLANLGNRKNEAEEATASFMEEIIVGRPVFSFPNRIGGFRLRYGRARTTGLAAVGVHPATMIILNKFLCTGVQLRIELPGKSAAVTPVDSIEPPVVKLKDGTVQRVETEAEAQRVLSNVEEILALGDVLINVGDFLQNNKKLLGAGYDENQWHHDLKKVLEREGLDSAVQKSGLSSKRIGELADEKELSPTPEEAASLTRVGTPLHPRYTYVWGSVGREELLFLRDALAASWPETGPYNVSIGDAEKRTLEKLLVPHKLVEGKINLDEAAPILELSLALDQQERGIDERTPLEIVRGLSGADIRDKAPVYVGARMGRPEKAKERKMSPYVHGLFPVGNAGGPQRNILKAERGRSTSVQIVNRHCPRCRALSFGVRCHACGEEPVIQKACPRCRRPVDGEVCPVCKIEARGSHYAELDLRALFDQAWKKIGGPLPSRFKCVKGLMNKNRTPEPLEKGLLRARYDLSVFKDGTLRYDLTDVPLTHFTPEEVGLSIEKLWELGYTQDRNARPLDSYDQMLELKVQDIIIPEDCGDYLVKASRFIDDLLSGFYGLEPYYKIKNRSQVIGHLIQGLAPHTSATIIGRVIGYTKNRVCYAHPLWHAAKRRNCDGDEDGIMLALDPLLNFSREFLPEQSGGLMDAPLYVIPTLNPSEVDKESHNVDVVSIYQPEFYELCEREASPSEYGALIDTIGKRLGTQGQFQEMGYTEGCSDINMGAHPGAYNTLRTMLEKLESQMELSEKLRAVEAEAVALRVLTSHFMKDIVGNLRAFTRQRFRCMDCNRKYRRPPLKGVCLRCGGKLSLTVYKGGIEKYILPAIDLVNRFSLDDYYTDRLGLVREEIASIFKDEELLEETEEKQISLTEFMRS